MTISKVAIIGSGVIGSSWAIVYARAGCQVSIFDRDADAARQKMPLLTRAIRESEALLVQGETVDEVTGRIVFENTLADALGGAGFVHECIEEKIDSKKAIFSELATLAEPDAILATTTSSFPVSQFVSDLSCRARCIVVHPATPPHLLPVTEVCPAPFTAAEITEATFAFLRRCGQEPVLIKREIPNFVLNRMQGALLVEMLRCLNEDLISPEDIDRIISQGFGLRWAILGPFEGVDLNSTGGIRQYLETFGFIFDNMAHEFGFNDVVTPQAIERLETYARAKIPLEALRDKVSWRDRSIVALRKLKETHPPVDRS